MRKLFLTLVVFAFIAQLSLVEAKEGERTLVCNWKFLGIVEDKSVHLDKGGVKNIILSGNKDHSLILGDNLKLLQTVFTLHPAEKKISLLAKVEKPSNETNREVKKEKGLNENDEGEIIVTLHGDFGVRRTFRLDKKNTDFNATQVLVKCSVKNYND